MDALYESFHGIEKSFFGWKLSAGAWSDPCSDQDKSCAHYWAHLRGFLHDKHLSLGLK